ncbi:MAG: TetR family transcriptional regulator [Burkholderiales bacterium]|nr:TetR family transcriptional regulator [Burkholderiales bacterium]
MQKGFEAVGMREIARTLGLQPTQVYRLKLSKTDILAEVIIELNTELIAQLPTVLKTIEGNTALERTCAYLLALYRFDIAHLPLRSVGAMYGWSWSDAYEGTVVAQVMHFWRPLLAGCRTKDSTTRQPVVTASGRCTTWSYRRACSRRQCRRLSGRGSPQPGNLAARST